MIRSFQPRTSGPIRRLAPKGRGITGLSECFRVYHDFRYHPREVITGSFDSWMYDHNGVFAWTVEIWSPQREAGIQDYKFIDWYREHPVEDDFKMLRWSDEALGGKGYVEWYPFNHPELGQVELGGWNKLFAWRNPPPELLEREVSKFPRWLVWHCLISPRLDILEASAKPLGDGTYRVRMVVQNTGWLPTYVTKRRWKRNYEASCAKSNCLLTRRSRPVSPARKQDIWKVGLTKARPFSPTTILRSTALRWNGLCVYLGRDRRL